MKTVLMLLAAACATVATARVEGAPTDGPTSIISIYGGGAFIRQYSGASYDDGHGYGYDYGYSPYYRVSNTYSGSEFGFEARIVMPLGFLLDVTGEQARVSNHGDAYKEQQLTAGLGYTARIGSRSSWSAEAFYQHYRLGEDYAGCDYSCNGWYNANGGGVKGGFKWPFADRWFGTLNMSVSYLSGQGADFAQAKIDGAVGYMFTDYTSLSIGASSQAMDRTDNRYYDAYYGYGYNDGSNDVLGHTAVFAQLAVHF